MPVPDRLPSQQDIEDLINLSIWSSSVRRNLPEDAPPPSSGAAPPSSTGAAPPHSMTVTANSSNNGGVDLGAASATSPSTALDRVADAELPVEERDNVNKLADKYSMTLTEEDFKAWAAASKRLCQSLLDGPQQGDYWKWLDEQRVPRIFRALQLNSPVTKPQTADWISTKLEKFAALERRTGLTLDDSMKTRLVSACQATPDVGDWIDDMWIFLHRLLDNRRTVEDVE